MSHAMCVRGLKQKKFENNNLKDDVARHVRAWIETIFWRKKRKIKESHAMCVRGLKPKISKLLEGLNKSHAMCVRGLKHRQNIKHKYFGCRTPCACVD